MTVRASPPFMPTSPASFSTWNGHCQHSYCYAWAERAKTVGYPERFAQEALGHNSKAAHRAYERKAQIKIPSLEDYRL